MNLPNLYMIAISSPSKEEKGQIPLSLKISTSYLFGVGVILVLQKTREPNGREDKKSEF